MHHFNHFPLTNGPTDEFSILFLSLSVPLPLRLSLRFLPLSPPTEMGDDAATTHDATTDGIAHALAFFTRAMWHVVSPLSSLSPLPSTSFCVSAEAEAERDILFTTIHNNNNAIISSEDLHRSVVLFVTSM